MTPLTGCSPGAARTSSRSLVSETQKPTKIPGRLAEAPSPLAIRELNTALESYQPQVKILSPKADQVLQTNTVSVRLQVKDLPIYKNDALSLGPHLHVVVDNQPDQDIYDLNQSLNLKDLSPGTHTIRIFAARPWHESFKNEGAYAQTTFHVYAKTQDNTPDPKLPLITYNQPDGTYGAEPIMLDFYLSNAPLHYVAQEDKQDDIVDWRIRCTVNGESFLLDSWQPVYLKGFKQGDNWVQLEFLDETGQPVKNAFNNTVRLIRYEPGGDDTLSKLVRGDLSAAEAREIVDPNYTPPEPTPEAIPTPEAVSPSPEIPIPELSPIPSMPPEVMRLPEPAPVPERSPAEEPEADGSEPLPMPSPEVSPGAASSLEPESIPEEPEPEEIPTPEMGRPDVQSELVPNADAGLGEPEGVEAAPADAAIAPTPEPPTLTIEPAVPEPEILEPEPESISTEAAEPENTQTEYTEPGLDELPGSDEVDIEAEPTALPNSMAPEEQVSEPVSTEPEAAIAKETEPSPAMEDSTQVLDRPLVEKTPQPEGAVPSTLNSQPMPTKPSAQASEPITARFGSWFKRAKETVGDRVNQLSSDLESAIESTKSSLPKND